MRLHSTFAVLALMTFSHMSPVSADAPAHFKKTEAYLPLASEKSEAFSKLTEGVDSPASGRVPNYLRALAAQSEGAAQSFAHLFRTTLYGGTLSPEIKAAMGLKIAKANGSDYLAAHLARILNATPKGKRLLSSPDSAEKAEQIALHYAVDLNRDVHGVNDSDFAKARAQYNDSQLVELTAVTCFFNYFSRFCQGSGLPLEAWVKTEPDSLPADRMENDDTARVSLASDAELQTAVRLLTPPQDAKPDAKKGMGIGIANSQRAMMRVADIGDAWWSYGKSAREGAKLSREMQLHISFAVSMANGCRYCTLHQVMGLRKQGVEIAKLVSMEKSDSSLSPRELAVVIFSRKLSKTPGAMQGNDYVALKTGLGDDREAYDALLQTCMFSFMNRFTDGLRLPSEDEAVRVYKETYGEGAYKKFPHSYGGAK